jgi:hypothetical protein
MTSPPTELDIDQLATAVREGPDGVNIARLWRAVFRLENWWLLPTGDPADPRPMVGVVAERTFLLAFTSERHIKEFAENRDGPVGEGGIAAMSITPAALTGLAPALVRQDIAGVLFNQGTCSFVAPVSGLDALSAQFSAGPDVGPRQ